MFAFALQRRVVLTISVILLSAATLSGCADGVPVFSSKSRTGWTRPKANSAGFYKVGTPYQIKGTWYYPREDYSYREEGVASWYGDEFHNKVTANGEMFDMNTLTAAHRTLPLPCMVRVTNLENGRSLVVRVNDRGPFANNRIIDMSRRGAQLLGFLNKGTTKVRVEVLPEESRKLKEAALGKRKNLEKAVRTGGTNTKKTASADNGLLIQKDTARITTTARRPALANVPVAKPAPQTAPMKLASAQPQQMTTQIAPAAPMKNWVVQAGAFSSQENATALSAKLQSVGNSYISPVEIGGKTLYRVRVGLEGSKSQADMLVNAVKEQGIAAPRLFENGTF